MTISLGDGIAGSILQCAVFNGPLTPQPNKLGDVWIDTSVNPAIPKTASSITPVVWTVIEGPGAPTDASFIVLSPDASLTDERVLTAGTGIDFDDAGAGSTLTVNADVAAIAAAVLASVYPIGSLYFSDNSTNPATSLGFGTWGAYGAGRVPVGFDAGNPNFDTDGETGGAATVTSTGSVAAPTLSGSTAAEATHTHGVTSNVTVGNHSVTQPTVAWPVGVPTAASGAVADHAAHTHSVTSNVTVADHAAHTHSVTSNVTVADHAAHTHSVTSNVTVADHAAHTHTFTQSSNAATPDLVTVNTGGTGVAASGTTGNPGATLTHTPTNNAVTSGNPSATLTHTPTNNAVTSGNPSATLTHTPTNNAVTSGNPSATLTHSVTNPTIAWPAGVPTASGAAVDAHSVTNNAVTSGAGASHLHTVGTLAASAPAYTGNATSVLQPYIVVRMWQRTA